MMKAAKDSEQRFRAIFDNAMVGMLLIDLGNGKFSDGNKMICQMLGYGLEEIKNLGVTDIYPEMVRPHVTSEFEKLRREEITPVEDLPMKRKDGTIFYAVVNFSPVTLSGKNYLIGLFRDITKRRQAERALQDSEAYLRTLMDSIQAGVIVIDVEKRRIADVNEAAAKLIGASKEEIIGKECHEHVCPAEKGKCPILDLKQTIDKTERVLINSRCEKIPILKTVVPIRINRRDYLLESFIDISDRKRAEEELEHLAVTDSLTQAYNRVKFAEVIKREMERARRHGRALSIVMFDVDHFKKVNDNYGHSTGDYVLRTLTQVAKRNLREIDYLIRWGGEEFLVIAPDTDLRGARAMGEKIRKAIGNFSFDKVGGVTVSAGVAQFRKDDSTDSLIKRADDALYEAKEKGRDRVEAIS